MDDTRISDLNAITTVASGDLAVLVDISDATMAPSGTDKKLTVGALGAALVSLGLVDAAGAATAAQAAAQAASQPLDADLTAIAALPSTSYGQSLLTLADSAALRAALPASGVTAATYGDATHSAQITIDAKGRITAASDVAIASTGGAPTGSAGGDLAGTYPNPTLNTVGSAIGPIGTASRSVTVTIDTKGRVTALTDQPIAIANTAVSGLGTMSTQNANAVAITGGTITGVSVAPSGTAGGDLSSTYPNPTVAKINGVAYNADPVVQYALLAGRSSGQTLVGGTASADLLTVKANTSSTNGVVHYHDDVYLNANTGGTYDHGGVIRKAGAVYVARNITQTGSVGRTVTDGVLTSGSATITSATAAFTTADLGYQVSITSATPFWSLGRIITINSATSVTLDKNVPAANAGTGVGLSFFDVSVGSPIDINMNVTYNYAGAGGIGPIIQPGMGEVDAFNAGPRGLLQIEGTHTFNNNSHVGPVLIQTFPIIRNAAGVALALGGGTQIGNSPRWIADGAACTLDTVAGGIGVGFQDNPQWYGINSGTLTASGGYVSFGAYAFVLAGATIAKLTGFFVNESNVTGTLTEHIGLRIESLYQATTNTGIHLFETDATFTGTPGTTHMILVDSTFTFDHLNAMATPLVDWTPTFRYRQTGNIFGSGGLINAAATYESAPTAAGAVGLGLITPIHLANTYRANTQNVSASSVTEFWSAPALAVTGGATSLTMTQLNHFRATTTIGANTTLTTRYGLYVADAAGTGTITTQYGIWIDTLAAAGANYGVWCLAPLDNFSGTVTAGVIDTPVIQPAGGSLIVDSALVYITGDIAFSAFSSTTTYSDDTADHYLISDQATYQATTGSLALSTNNRTIDSNITIQATGSSTITSGAFYAGRSRMTVAGIATVTNRYGWVYEDATLSSFAGAPYTRNVATTSMSTNTGSQTISHTGTNFFITGDDGATVTGPGIQAGTTIVSHSNVGGTSQAFISRPATATATVTLFFTRSTSATGYTGTTAGPGVITTQYGVKITATNATTNYGVYVDAGATWGIYNLSPSTLGTVVITAAGAMSGVTTLSTTNSWSQVRNAAIPSASLVRDDTVVTATNTNIGQITFVGTRDTSHNIVTGAIVFAMSEGAYASTTNAPTQLRFATASATTAALTRVVIDSTGSVHHVPTFTTGLVTASVFAVKNDGSVWVAPSAYTSNQPSAAAATILATGQATFFGTAPATQTASYDLIDVANATAVTHNAAALLAQGVYVAPTVSYSTAVGAASNAWRGLKDASTHQNTSGSAGVLTGIFISVEAAPTFQTISAHASTVTNIQGFRSGLTLAANGATGTLTVTTATQFNAAAITVPTNATVTTLNQVTITGPVATGTIGTRRGITIVDGSGAGLTTNVGIDIAAMTAGGTTNLGIRTFADVLVSAANIQTDTTTGMKIGTATTQKLGFFGGGTSGVPVVQQTQGATVTNSVTAGGSANTIANFTSLTTYSTDAATIRNDIYQLTVLTKTIIDALRLYGLLS